MRELAHQEVDSDSALSRSRVYGFLRRVFTHEVDEEFLAWCRKQGRLGLWSDLRVELGEVLEAADSEAALEDLAVDFCRLFIISGRGGSPHESLHVRSPAGRDGSALLWGDPASAMKDLYREAGFELDEEAHQLPDALGVEFEFMERLCRQEAAARREECLEEVERLGDLQRRMLKEHLAQWVPDYTRKLAPKAGSDFYLSMLNLAADFVEQEAEAAAG